MPSDCYVERFGPDGAVCEDIHEVMNEAEAGRRSIPDHELLVGGFPCQDYSVAKTLNQATGIVGKKGVLWWEIYRLLMMKRPPLPVPRERRPPAQVADEAARSRLRRDACGAGEPRLRGRVARGQRRRLRVPTEATTRAPHRAARRLCRARPQRRPLRRATGPRAAGGGWACRSPRSRPSVSMAHPPTSPRRSARPRASRRSGTRATCPSDACGRSTSNRPGMVRS